MYGDANDFSGAQVFTGLRFTFGSGGNIALTYRGGGSFINTGLSVTTLSSSVAYTFEIVGNNKSAGTINYTYFGSPQTVAVQKFDLFLNGVLIGDDLAEAALVANTNIASTTFIGTASTSNVANIFVDDVVVYNTVPAAIGSSSTPDIALSSPNPAVNAGNMAQGSTNNPIYRFDLAVTTANATLNGVTVTTAGTYAAADLVNLKCWYSADAVFDAGSDQILSTKSTGLGAGAQAFSPFTSQLINSGSTGYIFITADLACSATIGNTLSVNAITTADISFVSGNKSGTAFAGDAQTIIAATLNNVTGAGATNGNAQSSVSWTNPTGCYDEVLIVAAAGSANSGTPTGDGSAYTADLSFGAGTALGNGFVVYKGTVSPQVVTNLINGTTYYFKLFTRYGSSWSSGIEVSATPTAPVVSTYTWSGGNGAWTTAANWTPTRTTPDVTDILQFNDGGSWTVTAVPAQTIGRLLVTGNTSINLQAGAANTLTIAGGTGTDLDISAGSSLNIDGASVLSIVLSTGATGAIAGNMTFTIADHRLNAADASAIQFSSPAVFTQGTGCTGNVFTNTGTAGVIIFGNGSTFVQNAGSNPFGFAAPASKVIFQTGSLYKYQLASSTPSLSNRTYADFELANGGTTTIASGTTVWTMDNLRVSNGTFNITTGLPISIKGSLQIDASQTFNYSPSGTPNFIFNGTAAQSITNNGTLTFGSNAAVLISNTSASVTLNTDVQFNNLTISPSSILNLNGFTLSVTGDMTNNGALTTGTGTVDFTSASGTQTLITGGTGTGKTFYNLAHSGASTLALSTNALRTTNHFTNNAGPFNASGLNVTVGGNLSATGTYTPGASQLTFNGGANQGWSGAAGNNYGDVSIAKSAGDVVLGSAVTLANLSLSTGHLEMGTHNLLMTGSASGGSSTGYIKTNGTGMVTIQSIGAPARTFPVGHTTYNPLIIANGSGYDWTVKVKDGLTGVAAPYNTDGAVLRTWTISPSTNPPATGPDLTFQWDGTDPTQVGPVYDNNANVQLWHYDFAWISASVSTAQAGAPNARTLTRSGWTRFSDFAISNFSSPLPVGLVSFSGYKDGRRNLLQWTTSSELNNLGFEVQRSADGLQYSPVGFVNSQAAGGNSTDVLNYTFADNAPAGLKQYYRLRQVDIGGQARFSSVVLINSGKPSGMFIQSVYPNPARGPVQLVLTAPGKETVTVLVTDMMGRNLLRWNFGVDAGSNTLPLDVSALSGGTYIVRVLGADGSESQMKLVKE